jgi:hypothetical protein
MIAILCDKDINWEKWLNSSKSFKKLFLKDIYPKLMFYFPDMYKRVMKYYSRKGRSLTKKEFETIVYLRFASIYKISKKYKKYHVTKEHPTNCRNEKVKSSYILTKKIYKSKQQYGGK